MAVSTIPIQWRSFSRLVFVVAALIMVPSAVTSAPERSNANSANASPVFGDVDVRLSTGHGPWSVATGDVNADGVLDLASSDVSHDEISVLLGLGGGAFGERIVFSPGGDSRSVVITDLDGNGHDDIVAAVGYPSQIWVRRADGQGGFGLPFVYPVESAAVSVASGDFDENGYPDLAVLSTGGFISILLGTGSGGLVAGGVYPAPEFQFYGFVTVAVGDMDEDGWSDVVAANYDAVGPVSILAGSGGGGLAPPLVYDGAPSLRGLAVADFHGDQHLDVAVVSQSTESLQLLLGDGESGLAARSRIPLANRLTSRLWVISMRMVCPIRS